MKYAINIHAHSIFSDGFNSPYIMALEAKKLGFTALVITDHFYGRRITEFMSHNSMRLLKKACAEAKDIIPIIIGIEVPFLGQEVLIFGGAAIQSILKNGKPNAMDMQKLKSETGCAVILCHPGQDFEGAASFCDGYEKYNSGSEYFVNGRSLKNLEGKQAWCNSDAHEAQDLGRGYNLVDSKIETETDLIKYIKKGRQPEFLVTKGIYK